MVEKPKSNGYDVDNIQQIVGNPYSVEEIYTQLASKRESIRMWVIRGILGCIMLIFIVIVFAAWFPPKQTELLSDITKILLSSFIGLLGTAIGFYFRKY